MATPRRTSKKASKARRSAPLTPIDVLPASLGDAIGTLPRWFLIGGQAVRCLCPYRPSRDVDFGVHGVDDLDQLVRRLKRRGSVEIVERSPRTVHLRWNGLDVSVFVLESLEPFVEGHCLSVTGLLATKLHAIIDRGLRRDFFDLYVILSERRLGIVECLAALREVYPQPFSEQLVLRALSHFDDADAEPALPGEGPTDWRSVKTFFAERVGALLLPPGQRLAIQGRRVDLHAESKGSGRNKVIEYGR